MDKVILSIVNIVLCLTILDLIDDDKNQKQLDKYNATLDYIWLRESNCGQDPRCREIGIAGEMGEYQIRQIFIDDVKRINGYVVDPYDNESCRKGITIWLNHYAPLCEADTTKEQYELYRRGYSGYKTWKGTNNVP